MLKPNNQTIYADENQSRNFTIWAVEPRYCDQQQVPPKYEQIIIEDNLNSSPPDYMSLKYDSKL